MVGGQINLTSVTLISGLSLKLHEFYEISISDNSPLKLNQRKYITIIECLKTCSCLKIAYTLEHFRTLTRRLQIQRGRVLNLPYEDSLCSKCSFADIGDEFHYVFSCSTPPPPSLLFFLYFFSPFGVSAVLPARATQILKELLLWSSKILCWCHVVLMLFRVVFGLFVVGFDLSTVYTWVRKNLKKKS